MEIRKVKISDLKPSEYNPRKISDSELKKLEDSMDKFGYVEPLVWNEKTGNIVGGHQRLKILAKKLKDEVEVVVVNLDEYQEKALNLALNRISGDWDEDKLVDLLTLIQNQDKELLKYIGFDEGELLELFGLNKAEQQNIMEDRLGVIEVFPPEAPRLKEKAEIHCENIDFYIKVKEIIENKEVKEIIEKILELK